jgi:hypothetical protein
MSNISQGPAVAPHGLMKTSNNSNVAATPGSNFFTADGRSFKYVLAGAVDLPEAVLVQSPAIVVNHQGLTGTSQKIGDSTITVTLGATLATSGQYSAGFLEVSTGTGAGQRLKITSNTAAALSTTSIITLEDSFVSAVDGTSRFNLIADLYSNVVINPIASTGAVVGATVAPIPAGQYGYVQIGGPATILNDADATIAVSTSVTPSATLAGAVEAQAGVTSSVGFAINAIVASQYGSVYLQL